MSISNFASKVNHPLCEYMQQIPFQKANQNKQKLYFLSGDPTAYGNNQFRMPEEGYEIMRKHISHLDSHGYTASSGVPQAREAVLKLYKPKIPITANNVTIQHGVNQGLLVVLNSFTNPGDQILVPQIGYPIFQQLAPASGVKVVKYKLIPQKNFEIDLQHLQSLLSDKSQFLFVINPSNPMGSIFSKQHMQDILAFCDRNELPLVSDEVYHGQAFEGVQFHSFGDLTVDVPVIVLCGVEKVFSVPGWCTSWSVLFDKHGYLQNIWRNIMTSGMIFLHSNKFTQLALPELIEKVGLFTRKPIQSTKKIHDRLLQKFNSMPGFKAIAAQGTFYMVITVDVTTFKDIKSDREMADKLLEEQNVALMPLSIFGGQLNGFRLLTCGREEMYQELVTRVEEFSAKHRN